MRISRSFIDELMTRVDIVELIDNYVSLRKTGREYKACCPFHNEKTPSFTVSPDKQFYYCFGCGAHGNAIGFLIDFARLSYVEAIHELASRLGISVIYEEGSVPDETIKAKEELYEVMAQAAHYYWQQWQQTQSQVAKEYLKTRGLTGQTARDFGIGYAPPGWNNILKYLGNTADMHSRLLKAGLIKKTQSGRSYYDHFRDRIIFPIHDRRGRVIAFGGRLLTDKENEPKYLNSPETPLFQKGYELYGWYFARKIRSLEKIIVVEGYMDVVMLAQYGIRNVVATLGTATTREHLTGLFREVADLVFCFDGDQAGRKAAWRALENVMPLLQEGRQVSFVFLPQDEDPDTLVRKEGATGFYQRLTQTIPLSNFFFDTLTQQVALNTPEGQARLVELAKPLLLLLPEGPYRELMVYRLSQLTQTSLTKLFTPSQPTLVVKKTLPRPPRSFRELSLVHQAIICLLHKPALSQSIEYPNQKLSLVKQKDISLLLNLIELTRMNPQLTLGALCEHWRGTEYEEILHWLAQQHFPTDSSTINIDQVFSLRITLE